MSKLVWELLLLGAAFGVVGGTAVFRAIFYTDERRIRRSMKSVPTTAIRDVLDGKVVKIVGEVIYGQHTLRAPLSQRQCAFYVLHVDSLNRWPEQTVREQKGVEFFVRDAT